MLKETTENRGDSRKLASVLILKVNSRVCAHVLVICVVYRQNEHLMRAILWLEPSETRPLFEQEMAECTPTQALFYSKIEKFVFSIGYALMVTLRNVMGLIAHGGCDEFVCTFQYELAMRRNQFL